MFEIVMLQVNQKAYLICAGGLLSLRKYLLNGRNKFRECPFQGSKKLFSSK
jgi:hypothetical protein